VLGLHLRSFVTTTKPQHSLNHNLKSVPLVLTGNTALISGSSSDLAVTAESSNGTAINMCATCNLAP
jgi:hypothetical protein